MTGTGSAFAQKSGDRIPDWKDGYLDIHFINTGKGECIFLVMPDGTTMMVDAGYTTRPKPRVTDARPDDSRTPGEWITRYVSRILSFKNEKAIDYLLISHFNGDHIGDVNNNMRMSSLGDYRLSGVTEVGETIRFAKIIDRGWPDYNYPQPLTGRMMENYRKFLKTHMEKRGASVEGFRPGSRDQITLLDRPGNYPNFQIQNIAANGEIWTGLDMNTRNHFPPVKGIPREDLPSENMCSIALVLSYGAFDFYTGGDLVGVNYEWQPVWHDVETPVARAVGPVDVQEVNHHAYLDTENAFFLSTLRSRVYIIQVYAPSHPSVRALQRMLSEKLYPGHRH